MADTRFLGDQGGVDIQDARAGISENGGNTPQDFKARDSPEGGIGVWKIMPYVLESRRAEQGIGNRVAENICIGMSREDETLGMPEGDSPENEGSLPIARLETVDIIPDTAACDHEFVEWAKVIKSESGRSRWPPVGAGCVS